MDFNVCNQSFSPCMNSCCYFLKMILSDLSVSSFLFYTFYWGVERDTLTSMTAFQTGWAIRKFKKKCFSLRKNIVENKLNEMCQFLRVYRFLTFVLCTQVQRKHSSFNYRRVFIIRSAFLLFSIPSSMLLNSVTPKCPLLL